MQQPKGKSIIATYLDSNHLDTVLEKMLDTLFESYTNIPVKTHCKHYQDNKTGTKYIELFIEELEPKKES